MIQRSSLPATIRSAGPQDFAALATLARRIWLAHYITIISAEQIEYMLDGRFAAANLQRYLNSQERWLDVLAVEGELVGYCSYARTISPSEMKLEQLYLLPSLHGRGLGRQMLEHVERRAVDLNCAGLMLQVNKRNQKAIDVYRKAGYQVREEVVVDIGNGFVMDDFIMRKRLVG